MGERDRGRTIAQAKRIHIIIYRLRHGTPGDVYRRIRKCGRTASVIIVEDERKLDRALELIQRYGKIEFIL